MNIAASSYASFDVLLLISERDRWVNFVNGWCKVELIQSKVSTLCYRQDRRTVYQYHVTPGLAVKRTGANFVQVKDSAGPDRIMLGMKFRNEAETSDFMVSLQNCLTPGYASTPSSRALNTNHQYQPEFVTVSAGNYQGTPSMRNDLGYHPRKEFDRRQGYSMEQRHYRNGIQLQSPVRDGVHMVAPPTIQGGAQEAKKSHIQSKPVINSKQELQRYVELLEVALAENDTVLAKIVVNSLIEARNNHKNFIVKISPNEAQPYFKLCVKIEREMFPEDDSITYFLLVAEDFTIQHLQDMIELKFSISGDQQHWIIGNVFVNDREATLRSFGVKTKGAEVHLFISKQVERDALPVNGIASSHELEWNRHSTQRYQGQQCNQPPPEQQYYPQYHHKQNQHDQYHCQQNQYHHQQNQYHYPDQHFYQPNQHPYQQDQRHYQQDQHHHHRDQHHYQKGQHHYQQGHYNHHRTDHPYSVNQPQQFNTYANIPLQSLNSTYNNQYHQRSAAQNQHYNNLGLPHTRNQPNNFEVVKQPDKPPTPPKIGWTCPKCTYVNAPYRPGCELCGENRPADYQAPLGYTPTKDEVKWLQDAFKERLHFEEYTREEKRQQEDEARKNYQELLDLANRNLIPNDEKFDCPICFLEIEVGEGVKLKECFHCCCKDCLHDHILACREADVKCPCNVNDEITCKGSITEAEMRSILTEDEMDKVHNRGLVFAEGQAKSYHCKTADCRGFCFYEDEVNNFDCPVCNKRNCLLCKAIHHPEMNCKEYQEDLRIKAANDKAAQETQQMLEDMIKNGEAMYCPNENCRLIIQKKDGCDWIQCSCGTEICWVTKGPRWGPKGHGDTSGGCKCDYFGGRPCHPNCGCCH